MIIRRITKNHLKVFRVLKVRVKGKNIHIHWVSVILCEKIRVRFTHRKNGEDFKDWVFEGKKKRAKK